MGDRLSMSADASRAGNRQAEQSAQCGGVGAGIIAAALAATLLVLLG